MFDYSARRARLLHHISGGVILFMGNLESPMNYKGNPFPFRQDSSFLYYFGLDQPELAVAIDANSGETILFGNDFTLDDIVWMGSQQPLKERAEKLGIKTVKPYQSLQEYIREIQKKGRLIHFLPPYQAEIANRLGNWFAVDPKELPAAASRRLIEAVVVQRSIKSPEEIQEMEKALRITGEMHLAVMRRARPGITEANLAGTVEGIALAAGGRLAYPAILTVNGQILHNHDRHHQLEEGQLILGDFGAETPAHYAADITRTIPVSQKFSEQQQDVYQIVLDSQVAAIEAVQAGVSNLDLHLFASHKMVEGLIDLGLMKGDAQEAVAQGAHALFFPHGLGHHIGLDVHDMENLGEDQVGYGPSQRRSSQFGLKSLRLARKLETGFVITIEPGIYFIPELMDRWEAESRFKDFINYAQRL